MTDKLTQQQSSELRFRREVADRFGVLPDFFCSAEAAPGFGQDQDKAKVTRAGFDADLTKPADGAALAGIVADRVSGIR